MSNLSISAPWSIDPFLQLRTELATVSAKQAVHLTEVLNSLDLNPRLADLSQLYAQAIEAIQAITPTLDPSLSVVSKLGAFLETLKTGETHILSLLNEARTAAEFLDLKFNEMDFSFLLDKTRGVFSIGYNVTNGTADSGLYDLLGSESRLASFVAIAKGDVTQEHWFRLGRQLVPIGRDRALISWTASMFEYLMPLLVMHDYENTLLDETAHSIVARQIKYGHEYRVPWGISEAGYNARDLQLNYQYGPFGIPGLGLKRGLSHDLVVSPYSSILASQVDPTAALINLKQLISCKLLTEFGFYESVDYTPERLPENTQFAVIKSFMAHHQGMSLVAINNVINSNVIQNRFHADPRVRATRLLLQERIPRGVIPVLPKAAEIELEGKNQLAVSSLIRNYPDPNHSSPRIQLLSNQTYSVMISTAGSGYSKCGDAAVTRWKEDATRDNWGSFIFIKDSSQAETWSTSYLPFAFIPQDYKVTFSEEKVEFRRRDGDISTHTQIIVAPEDNVEIRHVTLTNSSSEPRILELTSYLEPVLEPPSNDLDHLAFSKLFIQTEFLASQKALLAHRRKRSPLDKENWGIHVVVTDGEILSEVQYETDRGKFLGRGRTLADALALSADASLTNTVGSTLDPCLSLRIQVRVPPLGKTHVAFTTGLASTREKALELADRYHDIHSFDRECTLAWTKAQVDMRHLNIDSEAAYLYQRLAERVLYLDPSLRTPAHQRAANTNVQSSLWPIGISGDLPIVVIRIGKEKDIAIVRKLIRCHEYLRLKGLSYDFVIINEHETTYLQDLQDDLLKLIRTTGSQGWLNKAGGIFILRRTVTPEKDVAHILSVARVLLNADEPLKDQISRKSTKEKHQEPLTLVAKPRAFQSHWQSQQQPQAQFQKPDSDLGFFNGAGGFSPDGREYVIILQAGLWTPAPWINVVGNSSGFGFQVSESGSGFTWSINSQTNRLTPWSNDPVSDPPGEILYVRDEDTGEVWSPTPLPIRSDAPYTIKHGHGYTTFELTSHGITHRLTLFVPKEDSVKVSLIRLKNLTHRKRRLTVTNYVEWVLGTQRTKTAPFLICDLDPETEAIFAINPHDDDFSTRVAFADTSGINRTYTCSRKEFIGRNGSYANPEALRAKGLSRKMGTGQDPCAALQTFIELKPGEECELSFLLGQTDSVDSARKLTLKYRDINVAKDALTEVSQSWTDLLNTIQVKTPDPAMNLLMNSWLLYQTLSCRYWARTAFYQSGGAYGFRDQLQDSMAFVYSAPQLTREHILRAAGRQFKEGDVQHWWHPPSGRGIRTRMSDDLLWLPFVVCQYVNVTGDRAVLTEKVPFLEAPLLKANEEDAFSLPNQSTESAPLLEHCIRAIEHSLSLGSHGLPFIGTGDWNDGMNRVGSQGKGESIWLGWFLYKVLADFMPFCEQSTREKYGSHMVKLKDALEREGWDGAWYRRAYFDDGTPLGSALSDECKIDSIAQSWAVISGAGDPARAKLAMKNVSDLLIRRESELVLLFTPPFEKTPKDPGYIQGYVPGVRENGGQYTHAATWVMMAFAELGDGNQAMEVFNMLNPILHSSTQSASSKYRTEPYAIAGDVYAGQAYDGRGGWSWYTGSASWYYRVGLENLLGFRLQKGLLKISPCIPTHWKEFEIAYTYGKSKYLIRILNPHGLSTGSVDIEMNGSLLEKSEIPLVDDGRDYHVAVTLLKSKQPEIRAHLTENAQLRL